jgi:DNA-binding response OmpR family regulator
MAKTIVLADNHADFLATWAEYLEMEGYQVYKTKSPEEAREIILSKNIHLAIFDKRLLDDRNEDDNSGIDLAKDPELGFIPSMILTDYPTHRDVREVLRPGESSAVDFIDKKEDGPAGMLEAVAHAFENHIPINWDLPFHWDVESGLSIPGILGMLDKNIPDDEYLCRKDELEDLLRMIFYEFSDVTILRWLWRDNERVALLAHGQHEQTNRYYAITIGDLEAIAQEIAHHKALPDDPGEGGTTHAGFYRRAHYAANAWRLSGVAVEQLESLQDAADNLKENQLAAVLTKLLQGTLLAWRKQRDPQEHAERVPEIYRKYFPLFQMADAEKEFRKRVSEIGREAKRHNLLQDIAITEQSWRIQIAPRQALTFPDPCQLLFHNHDALRETATYTNFSPGRLKLNTILLGADQVTWLTDLAGVDELPIWHDYACLECELRFTLLDSVKRPNAEASKLANPDSIKLTEIAALEQQLRPSWPKIPRQGTNAAPEMRKYANCILRVREIAYHNASQDPHQYALCLLFNALSELFEAEPLVLPLQKELTARLVHRLWLAGCICSDLLGERENVPGLEYPPLKINNDGMVYRGEELLHLTGTETRLLCVLHEHEGEPCDRELICREVFGIEKPNQDQLHGQIDTNISRLREKIEPEPKKPHYVVTIYGRGILLVTHPKADNPAK